MDFKKLNQLLDRGTKRISLLYLFLVVIAGLLEIAAIGIIIPYTEILIDQDNIRRIKWVDELYTKAGIGNDREFLFYFSLVILCFFLFKNMFLICVSFFQYTFIYTFKAHLSSRLYSIYLNCPYIFHLHRNSSVLVRNLFFTIDIVVDNYLIPLSIVITEAIILLFVVVFLLNVSWLSVVCGFLAIALPALGLQRWIRHRAKKWGEAQQLYAQLALKWANQGFGGIKDILLSGNQGIFQRAFADSRYHHIMFGRNLAVIQRVPLYAVEAFVMITLIVGALFLMDLRGSSADSLAIIAAFGFAVLRLIPAVSRILGGLNSMKFGEAGIDEIIKALKLGNKSAVESEAELSQMHFTRELVVNVKNFTYPASNRSALRNVFLIISSGQKIGIVGASGSGKTTLVDIICGLLLPSEGEILVDGTNISTNLQGWQKEVSYVTQDVYLIDDTIERNIVLSQGDEKPDSDRLKKVIEISCLEDVIDQLPDGLQSLVGERGVSLSGGQKQRIGIARALYRRTPLLILDEATSAMDNQIERRISEKIMNSGLNKTLIIIAHRMTTVENCDVLFFLEDGELSGSGSFGALIDSNESFRKMVQADFDS